MNKASNKNCEFFDPEYSNNCSATSCKNTYCRGCKFFVPKGDPRHKAYMNQFNKWININYYPNGSRK